MAAMDKFQRDRQQGLQADATRLGLGEGHPLAVLILRPVVGDDGVDRAILESLDDRLAILLGAQRRHELAEGPVVADRQVVQRKIGCGGIAGDPEAACLGGGDHLDRLRGRYLG